MRGFSLIEVLMVLGILIILLAAGLPVAFNFYYSYQFESEYNLAFSLLEFARNLSLVNYNESAHGLYIGSEEFTVFQGSSFAARNASQDRYFPRVAEVGIAGASELVFAALSGATASTTLTFSDIRKSRDLFINSEGLIYEPQPQD